MNNFSLITVRNSSKRLPGKPFLPIINNFPAIEIVIKRAKKIGFPVILVTSVEKDDDVFEKFEEKYGIKIFRGSLLNKIKRWNDCFKENDIDNALLIDGDDLAYDFDIGRRAIQQLINSKSEMIINSPEIICGLFTYAITREGISKLSSVAPNDSIDTDVITKFIDLAKIETEEIILKDFEKNKEFRLTLDYKEDLEFFQNLYSNLDPEEDNQKIIEFLEKNDEIPKINYYKQKEFLNNQKKFNEEVKI